MNIGPLFQNNPPLRLYIFRYSLAMTASQDRCLRIRVVLLLSTSLLLHLGCRRAYVPPYSQEEELKFRADEAKELAGPRGDLAQLRNQVFDGPVSIGGSQDSRIRLEHWTGSPMELILKGTDVVVAKSGSDAELDGKPLTIGEVVQFSGRTQQHWITNSTISMRVTKHKSGPWLQVFDSKSEPLQSLHALNFYPPSPHYRVQAEWVPISNGYSLTYHRTNGGSDLADTAPGYVQFSFDGKPYKLYATLEQGMLYIVFRDLTSRTETYPAARYLETMYDSRAFDPAHPFDPSKPARMALDFNQAVNPACAYNPNTHCPIAPPENHLPIAIPAGEKRYHELNDESPAKQTASAS